jgi:hypothetical protein|tara:strand:+ start:250 stop:585 length:336 start_codon:yes stop_codon:yes gene_type:complete
MLLVDLEHLVVVLVETTTSAADQELDLTTQEYQTQMFLLHHFQHLPHGLVMVVEMDHHKQMAINLVVVVAVLVQQEVEVKKMDLVLVVMEQFILLLMVPKQNMVLVVAVEE